MRRFAVFGNPVMHSKSPLIHRAFAAQHGIEIDYQRIEAPLDNFAGAVRHFFNEDGLGANVTVPFKQQAFELCTLLSERAKAAEAVNTLQLRGTQFYGDNTDGVGLVTDIRRNQGWQIAGKRILILGAGGAVRGVLKPLMDEGPAEITIANRTVEKAEQLAEVFHQQGISVYGASLDKPGRQYDLIINAISAGLHGDMPDLSGEAVGPHCACYDMVYGNEPTPFMNWAELNGAVARADGLGMLVEQAAESFYLWNNWKPDTAAVIHGLRRGTLS